ncbi:MAG: Spo0E family sporulation regulatory protein-aspartic acid phosphatase [Clostridiales bacterium]|nr:Spo0E family sporulation regulatory protein-aspartic acid phosphatase [Clostridiales bacterium]
MTKPELLVNIEKLRSDLIRIIEDKKSLTDTEVLAANRSVNLAIVEFLKLPYENNR